MWIWSNELLGDKNEDIEVEVWFNDNSVRNSPHGEDYSSIRR